MLRRTPVRDRVQARERGPRHKRFFINRILDWYALNSRQFPWRETDDPYLVFMAEFMLQRTGAQQVLPVFEDFSSRFPRLADAAGAKLATLRKILRPLGRVDRYRILRLALSYIVEKCEGILPTTERELNKIPGVGPYTARAVLVFSGKRQLGLLDPNVYRVVSRVFGLRTAKRRPHADPLMWRAVDLLVAGPRSREINLALLDFAVKVCRARSPKCSVCPVNTKCEFYARSPK